MASPDAHSGDDDVAMDGTPIKPKLARNPEDSITADTDGETAQPNQPQTQRDTNLYIMNEAAIEKHQLAIIVTPPKEPWLYQVYDEPAVAEVVQEVRIQRSLRDDSDEDDEDDQEDLNGTYEPSYRVELTDGTQDTISFSDLITLVNGAAALQDYESYTAANGVLLSSEDEIETMTKKRPGRPRRAFTTRSSSDTASSTSTLTSESNSRVRKRRSRQSRSETIRNTSLRTTGKNNRPNYRDLTAQDLDSSDDEDEDQEPEQKKPRLRLTMNGSSRPKPRQARRTLRDSSSSDDDTYRRSQRISSLRNMQEIGEDDIPTQRERSTAPRFIGAKEHFKKLPGNNDFRLRHCQICDTCNEYGDSDERGILVYCQGCTASYHQRCLGTRTSRPHLVTKVDERDFVLQCRRCINQHRQKEPHAPDLARCSNLECHIVGPSSHPLRERTNVREEHKHREANGEDMITHVLPGTINQAENVFFRCTECHRSWHFHHLPPPSGRPFITDLSVEHLVDERFAQYCRTWRCKDCSDAPGLVEQLVAWRTKDPGAYQPGLAVEDVSEDAKEYLIKWKNLSFFKVTWMTGSWVWGVTAATMRLAFNRHERSNQPKFTTEDAIPEETLRVDIVFDVEYTNVVNLHTIKVDQARIKEVKKALVKFKGLTYEEAVWVEPPPVEHEARWEDFRVAYDHWVMGLHTLPPNGSSLSTALSRLRTKDFATQIKLSKQPENLSGELMDYQLEGVNWIYYQWFRKQNAMLADEMGLGKTIQLIAFMATLKESHSCWPFLVVVPNSTCPNWRREIQQWAPSLRTVSFYGSAEARKLTQKYELFPDNAKELRCHVVVTSYEAAQDPEFRSVFRKVHWAGLIVDEGQRLKNDKNILFNSLTKLKIPFKILLTGTPLQNNARELFNLLQFLDNSIDAKALEEEYTTLTEENVPRLHEMLRPFILRRTKAGVLTFLPPIAQIIVPVSLTTLQRKLYRSILSANPELLKSVFGTGQIRATDRGSLNNILMQLRKCLCHPFVYSQAIEDRTHNTLIAHRNLTDASSKLKLLEIMLPKLQERGHRVLIFSQFLDMLDIVEDFLDGLGLYYQRLDGTISALQKQRRIDEFNAPDSTLFAFLLSTRAGGVGINLATADTVIILDPDFNPHQDIQALSRAHRIGQKKKVLVFQFTTRNTAEEKIMQIGKKKMALDHVLIDRLDAEGDAGSDLESILKHGTDAIFKDDDPEEFRYDSSSMDKLLDRSQIEDTLPGKDNSAESQFSFARVWANDRGVLEEDGLDNDTDGVVDSSVWDTILAEREREAIVEAEAQAKALGRGQRKRERIDYATRQDGEDDADDSPRKQREKEPPTAQTQKKQSRKTKGSDSDTDYLAAESEAETEAEEDDLVAKELQRDRETLKNPTTPPSYENHVWKAAGNGSRDETSSSKQNSPKQSNSRSPLSSKQQQQQQPVSTFKRVWVPPAIPGQNLRGSMPADSLVRSDFVVCLACSETHQKGYCPLKRAGVERCGLCGMAHYGHARVCPHLNSVTQCRAMMEAIRNSNEPEDVRQAAKKRIVGIISDLNQRRRRKQEVRETRKRQQQEATLAQSQAMQSGQGFDGVYEYYQSHNAPLHHPQWSIASGQQHYSTPYP